MVLRCNKNIMVVSFFTEKICTDKSEITVTLWI